MDPKANIKEQRELAAKIIAAWDALTDDDDSVIARDALRLAELVQALDEWRRKGGFDPYGAK